ncbi:MAG: hypothetical protein Q8Q59_05180 [Luteolibacter sp.]|jgi:hypothetical protein|nr:hypothetical protein [Luteolibacter sp.]
MAHHPQLWICLGLLTLAACKQSDTSDSAAVKDSPADKRPASTKSSQSGRDERPDPRKNLREAAARAEKIEEIRAREKALAEVAWNALELDPEFAMEMFERLSADGPERILLIQHFAMRMANEDPDAALEWAEVLGTERETAAAQARIALVIADSDPRRAANLLSESGISSREFDVAIVQVLQSWAGQNAPEAAAWVVMFPPGGFRKAGVEAVVTEWAQSDAPAAFSWLAGLNDVAVRNEATHAMAAAWRQQEPELQESWLRAADARTRDIILKTADALK